MLKSFYIQGQTCKVDIVDPILKVKENWTSVAFPRWHRTEGNLVLHLGSEFSAFSIIRCWVFKCSSHASFKISFALTLPTAAWLSLSCMHPILQRWRWQAHFQKKQFSCKAQQKKTNIPQIVRWAFLAHTHLHVLWKKANITYLTLFLSGKQVMGLTDSSCKYSSFYLKGVNLIVRASAWYCHSNTD